MAVMGIQLVITLIVATLLHKVAQYISPAQWTIKGLMRYKSPRTEVLWRYRTGQAQSGKKTKDRKKSQDTGPSSILNDITFSIPRDNDIELQTEEIRCSDIYNIHFCDNYEWIVNLFCSAAAVYFLTQLYFLCWPEMEVQEMNLSIIWLLVVLCNAVYIFYLLNIALFRGSEGTGEQSLMILCGFCFFVVAMAVMLLDDGILELGINQAFDNITAKAAIFKTRTQLTTGEWHGSLTVWKVFLGIMCGLLAAFLTFPSFRLARLHVDAINQTDSGLLRLLYNVSFFFPLFISILWVKPLARDSLVGLKMGRSLSHELSDGLFDVIRLGAVFFFGLLRIAFLQCHLQTYLSLAQQRFYHSKREPGRIVALELQSLVQRVFMYLLGVALQYVVPIILLLSWALLAHSQGSYSFIQGRRLPLQTAPASSRYNWGVNAEDEAVREIGFVISQFAEVVDTPVFWEKHVMFGCWWMITVGFVLSSCGVVYYRYTDV